MEAKFTKGKWEAIENSCYFDVTTSIANKRNLCVNVLLMDNCVSDSLSEENKANAKLIAAAPEMFEILKSIMNDNYEHNEKMIEIEQLLTKITEK